MVNFLKLSGFVGCVLPISFCFLCAVLCCLLCLTMFIIPPFTSGDVAADLVFIRAANPITTLELQETVRFNSRETSELKFAATGLIRLYQKFISSQDAPTCRFSPSCSRFGMGCIQEYGMIRGLLLTADRLLRCNGSQSRYYPIDEATGKYIDPVLDYAGFK